MDPAQVAMWFSVVERGLVTAGTIRAMLDEGMTPEQINAVIQRVEQRQANLRAMDLRG